MEPEKVLDVSGIIAYRTARRFNAALSKEDLEDLRMAAVTGILSAMQKFPDNEAYLWKSGKNEVIKSLLREIFGRNPLDAANFDDLSEFIASEEVEFAPRELPQDFESIAYRILLSMRSKKGTRGKNAAARDARIVVLALSGFNNSGIAQELGIPVGHVKKNRQEIRRRLNEFISLKNLEEVQHED